MSAQLSPDTIGAHILALGMMPLGAFSCPFEPMQAWCEELAEYGLLCRGATDGDRHFWHITLRGAAAIGLTVQ